MKRFFFSYCALFLCGAMLGCSSSSEDILPLATKNIPSSQAAQTLLNQAKDMQRVGKVDDAFKLYKNIARHYSNTSAGAEALFEEARILDTQGDLFEAFELYQKLIEHHPASPRYRESLKRQIAIAHAVAEGRIKNNFLGLKTRISANKVQRMLLQVRDNAPEALSASKAQFALGKVWQIEKSYDKAFQAYEVVTLRYPRSLEAPEAFYQRGLILIQKARKGNKNMANVNRAESIFEDLISFYPHHSRAKDARKRLAELHSDELMRSYQVAEFYRKKGKIKSALFYYREVEKKAPVGSQLSGLARAQIKALAR